MKKKQIDEGTEFASAQAPKTLGPADVQRKEFRVSRFGGYRMRDVDEFLDQITGSMNAMVEEHRKLRTQGGGSLIGAPDLADTSRQADEIIQRARAQAEQIVRDARAASGAKTGGSATGSVGPGDRSSVNAFLAQERTFLQSLAAVVQEHAETVKGMVRADRAMAPPARPPSDPRPTVPMVQVEEPIRVEDPATASVASLRDDDTPGDSSDRSLRELFWGED